MATLSTAGWIVHDVGLATNIGGQVFGMVALEPAVNEVDSAEDRDQLSEDAWNRFSWIKLASHAAFAVPWFIGRSMLSGNEVSARARALTRTKDILVGTSLITGIASFIIGKALSAKVKKGAGPERKRAGKSRDDESTGLEKAVSIMGTLNLLATTGVLAVTTILAMEGSESVRFAATTRRLP
jgi:hypothetical protein